MELLVFLGALELADYRDERPYFYSSQIEKIKSVHKLLTEELSVNYTTEELAKRFDISVGALKTGFKGVYGSPIYTYIRTYKMNVAASVLVTDRKKKIYARWHCFDAKCIVCLHCRISALRRQYQRKSLAFPHRWPFPPAP